MHIVLGVSWVVISEVVSPPLWVIVLVTLLITPLITAHEPLSTPPKRWKPDYGQIVLGIPIHWVSNFWASTVGLRVWF